MKTDLALNDLYEIRKLSPLSDFDRRVALDLYMPLVGGKAIAIYFALFERDNVGLATHEKLLRDTGFSVGEFVAASSALEATGLLATYLGSTPKCRLFSYCLYAPLSPLSFFEDPLFAGTLEKYIGREDSEKLAKKYRFDEKPEGYANVSMDFLRYFAPDLNDERYINSVLSSGGKLSNRVETDFSFASFLEALKKIDNRYSAWSFSQDELNYISRVKALYGYSEESLADFCNSSFLASNPINKRLDKKNLMRLCKENVRFDYLKVPSKESAKAKVPVKGDSGFAKTIRLMQSLRPIEFLSRLQKGKKIAQSDASLLEELTLEMGLTNEVANALVFYVLSMKNNALPKAYAEKIAASLVRENIETAIDAWNYFSKTSGKRNSENKSEDREQSGKTSDDEGNKEVSNDNENPNANLSFDEIFARAKKERK